MANLAVIIPKSLTLNGLAVVPKPSIVDKSATAPKAPLSNQATVPVVSVTRTESFDPACIFTGVTAASAILTVEIALFEITGLIAEDPAPAKSPANCNLPFTVVVASGVAFEVI